MNNIDILEEKEKEAIKELTEIKELVEEDLKYKDYNVTAVLDQIDLESLVIVLNLIETLIAENKELKEKIKEINEEYNAEQKHEMENTIPKSKVEETIQTMNTNILNAEKFDCDYIGQCRFAKYVLQFLLGKG